MPMQLVPIPTRGGVDLLHDPLRVSDEKLTRAKNLFPTINGKLQKRRGAISVGYGMVPDPFVTAVPTNFTFAPFGTVDWAATYAEQATDVTGLVGGVIATGVQTGAIIPRLAGYRPALINFGGKTYCLPGIDGLGDYPLYIIEDLGAGIVVTRAKFKGLGNTNTFPKVACSYRGRMVFATGQTLWMSDKNDPLTIGDSGATARSLIFPSMGGDRIVAMVEIMQTVVGSPSTSALLILGTEKAYILSGELAQTTDIGAYLGTASIGELSVPCGCVSAESLVHTPYGLIWAGKDDVWKFAIGAIPERIGTEIRPALQQCPPDKQWLYHAAYSPTDGSYRLALCAPGQGPTDYDPMGEQWWLDITEGLPAGPVQARWWGPQIYNMAAVLNTTPIVGTYTLAQDIRVGKQQGIYCMHPGSYGPVYTQSPIVLVQMDGTDGYDFSADVTGWSTLPISFSQCIGNEIAVEMLTKEYDFGDTEPDKLYLGTEMALYNGDVVQLTVEAQINGGEFMDTRSLCVDQQGYVVGVDPLGTQMFHKYQAVTVAPDPTKRATGRTIRLRIFDTPGFPVPFNGINKEFVFSYSVDGAPHPNLDKVVAVSLTTIPEEGVFWASIQTFMTNFLAVLVAAFPPGTFVSNVTAPPRPTKVTLTTDAFAAWAAFFVAAGSETGDQLRHSRKVFAMLGFSTTINDGVLNTSVTAYASVPDKISSTLEIADIKMRVYLFARRPAGGSDE